MGDRWSKYRIRVAINDTWWGFPYRGFLLPLWLIILLDQTEMFEVMQKSNEKQLILGFSLQRISPSTLAG